MKDAKKVKVQPKPVQKIKCPKCGELMLKIYPFSSYVFQDLPADKVETCRKCKGINI